MAWKNAFSQSFADSLVQEHESITDLVLSVHDTTEFAVVKVLRCIENFNLNSLP